MAHHEPCGPHEIFVGNTLRDGESCRILVSKGMRTARLGKTAYDIDGKPLRECEGYAPLFIHRSESDLHDSIMMERTFGPHWRRGR